MNAPSKDAAPKIHPESQVSYFALSARLIDKRIQKKFRADGIQLSALHAAILPAIHCEGTRLIEVARRTGKTGMRCKYS